MQQQRFGSQHTLKKLDALEKYLGMYTKALKNKSFNLYYFDAFAGTGQIEHAEPITLPFSSVELKLATNGSTKRALEIEHPFYRYIFVENSRSKLAELRKLKDEFPSLANRMEFYHGDANEKLSVFCSQMDWKSTRAVVFLDPFGNQVQWSTIEALAATNAVDLWYLFPAGLGVARQIGNDGTFHPTHTASLDRLFGTTEWKTAAVRESKTEDLFGDWTSKKKIATPASMTEFMIKRMKSVFEGWVSDDWLPLGSNNTHMYSLIFASANPSPKAKRLVKKFAKAVLE